MNGTENSTMSETTMFDNLKLRDAHAARPLTTALLYVAVAYLGGFALLVHAAWWSWPLGVLAVAHAMVIAAYLVHECAHNSLFVATDLNAALGRALLWIAGASYSDYDAIRYKHMRHHVDRADVIAVDYRGLLRRHRALRDVVIALERLYVPAVDWLMHALVIVLPFTDTRYRDQRARVALNLVVRGALFAALCLYSWQACVGYLLAYSLFMIVLRLMDMHQHTFAVFFTLAQPRDGDRSARPAFDKSYEQRNTYSNPLGRSALANLLVLNFGFHNAHHAKPALPWYRLPTLDRQLRAADPHCAAEPFPPAFPCVDVLRNYRRYRVARVLNTDSDDPPHTDAAGVGFIGVLGVSFLTAI